MYWWQGIRENDNRVLNCMDVFSTIRDERGLSNLHVSCEAGHLRLVVAFFIGGCDVNDRFPDSPIVYAALSGNDLIVSFLLRSGAKIPFSLDVCRYSPVVCKLLLTGRICREWFRWVCKQRQSRERQWITIIWKKKYISCNLKSITQYI